MRSRGSDRAKPAPYRGPVWTRTTIALTLLGAGACSRGTGHSADPVARAFEAPYGLFIAAAPSHRAGCEAEIEAKGEVASETDPKGEIRTKIETWETRVEVDDRGNFRLSRGDGFELVKVDGIAWQRADEESKLQRIESGARPDLLRDGGVAAWRSILRPFRGRLKLTPSGAKKLGDRDVETSDLSVEPGPGSDPGTSIAEGKGALEVDTETGFPVGFSFEGAWDASPLPPHEGKVTFRARKLACAVADLGSVDAIEPPEPIGPQASPVPSAAASPVPTKKPGGATTRGTKKPKRK